MYETLLFAEYVYEQWQIEQEVNEHVHLILTSNEEKEA
ncbi:hypothetical protein VPHD484_0375 [Vibrio phage D484]